MRQDRFLLGILAGIGVLVVLAVGLYFLRQGNLTYGPEDTPGGVVRNYVVALKKGDYDRAASYLVTMNPAPDKLSFIQAYGAQSSELASTSVEVGEESIILNKATVQLALVQGNSGLFNEPYRSQQVAELVRENGSWKIKQMPYPFWNFSWTPTVEAQPAPNP